MRQSKATLGRSNLWWRCTLTVAVTLLAMGSIGWGGLAGWSILTTNPNNSLSTGTLHMSNTAGGVTCTDLVGPCGTILSESDMKPTTASVSGTVTIVNTGSLAADYSISATDIPTPSTDTTICDDINIFIDDGVGNSIYGGSIGSLVASTSGGSPATTLPLTPENPVAATNGTFTLRLFANLSPTTPQSQEGSVCTAAISVTAIPA